MPGIKLSLCIPTFNRKAYLAEAIGSITAQLTEATRGLVEICISDNASTDGTDELIRELNAGPHPVVYFRWPRNMGADRNYLKVIELASGEYCWFLGSDDCLLPGSIARVLEELAGAPDIMLFDRADSDITLSCPPVHVSWSALPRSCAFHTLAERGAFLDYLKNCTSFGGLFSYLSVIVFNRSRWNAVGERDRFVGSAYVHAHVLFAMLKEGSYFKYVREPLVLCRTGNDSFLTDNTLIGGYRRIKLDIDGYRDIPMHVFGSDSEEYLLIHGLVGRCLPVRGLLKYKLAFMRNNEVEWSRKLDRLLLVNGFYCKYLCLVLAANRAVCTMLSVFSSAGRAKR